MMLGMQLFLNSLASYLLSALTQAVSINDSLDLYGYVVLANYIISLKHLSSVVPGLGRWCLDYPKNEQAAQLVELTEQGLVFQGWLLTKEAKEASVYLQQGSERTPLILSRSRPDVIKAVLQEPTEDHPQLLCGFRTTVKMFSAEFSIGVSVDGTDYPLIEAQITGPFKVLNGRDGWLFLDNDTNKSVEQFTGKLLLDHSERKAWKHYFAEFTKLAAELGKPAVMLMAPAKEAVYTQFYPYTKAELTTVDQLLDIVPAQFPLIYPVSELATASQRTFRITDSHWSVHGAMLASVLTAEKLGVDSSALKAIFAPDQFYQRQASGDLGNKVFPPATHNEDALASYSYKKKLVYDNQLPNFGRVLVLRNDDALVIGQLLLLGSSSAYSMLDYLSRIFSTVILVHTAGNIDVELVRQLAPDYFVTQTNARFVIRAPALSYSLVNSIAEKLAGLPAELRQKQQLELANIAEKSVFPITNLHQCYEQALLRINI